MKSNVTIHESVKAYYGSIAESQSHSCCASSSCSDSECEPESSLYAAEMLEGLPAEVTNLSLGCGDPVSIASVRPGETVLDLGSGAGIDCFLAARQVGETGHVIGVDMTPAMLEKANANKARMGITNVEFRQGQIEELPVADKTIDLVISNCVINLSPAKAAVFREVFRVLKPGGRVSISDIVTEGEFSEEMRTDSKQWAACITGAIDVNDYTRLMQEAGFVEVSVVNKFSADELISKKPEIPLIFSARITARKPD